MAFVYQSCFSGHAICCKNLTPVGVPHGFREAFHKVLLKITTENLAAPEAIVVIKLYFPVK